MATMYGIENLQREVDILVQANPYFDGEPLIRGGDHVGWENVLVLELPPEVYIQLQAEKVDIEEGFKERANFLLAGREHLAQVRLVPLLSAVKDWRTNIRSLANSFFGLPLSNPQYRCDVFVLMPFSGDSAQEVYEDHVLKVAGEIGLSILRGDDFHSNSPIMIDVWSAINAAKLIIADLTGKNSNVYYELGVAHTLGKKAILITQDEKDATFDLQHFRYIKYTNTPRGIQEFENNLKTAIVKILEIPKSEDVDEPEPPEGFDIPF